MYYYIIISSISIIKDTTPNLYYTHNFHMKLGGGCSTPLYILQNIVYIIKAFINKDLILFLTFVSHGIKG